MKIKSLPFPIVYLFCFLIGKSYATFSNKMQDITLKGQFNVEKTGFLNLENILQSEVPFQAKLTPNGNCKIQGPFLSSKLSLPFSENFPHGEKAFYFQGGYYIMKIDPTNSQIMLLTHSVANSSDHTQVQIKQKHRRIFARTINKDNEIIAMKQYENMRVFSTKSDLLFFNFENSSQINLFDLFAARSQILDFEVVRKSTLYVISDKLLIYDITDIHKKEKKFLVSYSTYTLPDGTTGSCQELQSILTSDNILFLTAGSRILVADGAADLNNLDTLFIMRVIEVNNPVIQIKKSGRSLIVLTSLEIIEYVFITDSLHFQENMRFSIQVFGFSFPLSLTMKPISGEVITSDNGGYFGLVNKLTNAIYIFQTASSYQNKEPYFYLHDNTSKIDSVGIFEYGQFSLTKGSGLVLMIQHETDKLIAVELERSPLGLSCSNWMPGTLVMSVFATAKFCHNTMYNYTDFIENQLTLENQTTYTDDFYYNPSEPCNRRLFIQVNFLWTNTLILCSIGVFLVLFVTIGFMIKLIIAKRKAFKHLPFQNEQEKGKVFTDASSQKIDISTLTTHAMASNTSFEGTSPPLANKRKKTYSKKKNLSIKIPED